MARHPRAWRVATVRILPGEQADRTSADDARRVAERLRGGGVAAQAIVYPAHGHRIPVDVRDKDVDPFIDEVLRGGPPEETVRASADG